MNTFEQDSFAAREGQASKLGAIRDIIFGSNIESFNQEVNEIRQLINKHRTELEANIQNLREQMMLAIQNLEREVESKIGAIEEATLEELSRLDNTHVSKDEFGKLMNEIGGKMQRRRGFLTENFE